MNRFRILISMSQSEANEEVECFCVLNVIIVVVFVTDVSERLTVLKNAMSSFLLGLGVY